MGLLSPLTMRFFWHKYTCDGEILKQFLNNQCNRLLNFIQIQKWRGQRTTISWATNMFLEHLLTAKYVLEIFLSLSLTSKIPTTWIRFSYFTYGSIIKLENLSHPPNKEEWKHESRQICPASNLVLFSQYNI